jgi:DNA-binding NarL/FixJ family response regulator
MTSVQARQAGSRSSRKTAALIAADGAHDAISRILDAQGFETTVFGCAEDVLDDSACDAPSVAVLCVWGSPSSLSQLVQPITQRFEQTPSVVVCAEIQRWEVRNALSAGAAGVVLYDELDAVLGACLQAVLAGQVCVPREHSQQIAPPALSSREKQILGLVVMGYMNGQIAEQLFVAESTVKSHLSSAFGKLGVRSRNEAVDLVLDPDRGLGMGILALGGDPVEATPTVT